jgi:hypothetical protein
MSIRIRKADTTQEEEKLDIHPKGVKYCKDCYHLYYNVVIPHRPNELFTPAVYKKNNTEPILQVPHHYQLAITRFSIGVGNIPILIAEPVSQGSNDLVYTFSLEYGGNIATENVIYEDIPVSGSYNPFKYFIYTYSRFLKAVNTALLACFTALSIVPVGSAPPLITFDPVTKLFTIVAQTIHYGEDVGTPIRVYMNGKSESLFPSWDTVNYLATTGLNGNPNLAYRIRFYDKGDNIDAGNYIMVQDYEMLTRWNSFKAIQITSNLPIQNEYTENDYQTPDCDKTTSQNILKDFIILYQESGSVARTTIDYSTKELEYIDMKGVDPLRNIEINIFWIDQNGKQYPLFLTNNETVLIKLMFKNKDQFY